MSMHTANCFHIFYHNIRRDTCSIKIFPITEFNPLACKCDFSITRHVNFRNLAVCTLSLFTDKNNIGS